jgi:hypothetical protein
MMRIAVYSFLVIASVLFACKSDKVPYRKYKTENIIIVVVDGARYSETWGDPNHVNIPNLALISGTEGVVNSSFYTDGPSYTTSGHTTITTGFYQEIDNSGAELPSHASYLQHWLKLTGRSAHSAYIIASKDKLEILRNTTDPVWHNSFLPAVNCGIGGAGVGSGYREDSITYNVIEATIGQYHPNLMLINFREPDYSAHQGNWVNYLKGIQDTDQYVYALWQLIKSDPAYKDKTTLFVTNDHGRHLNGVLDGFQSHGDGCEGCRHISLFAFGPDFKKGKVVSTPRELVDLHATILELLHLTDVPTQGEVMTELFN